MKISDWYIEHRHGLLLLAVLFLLAASSFALGYLYASQVETIPIVIEKCSE